MMLMRLKSLFGKYTDYKYAIICLISIAVFITTGGFIVWPLYEEHFSMEQESKAIEKRLQLLEQFASNHPDYEAGYNKLEQRVVYLQEQLPNSLAGIDVMNKMQQLANGSGVVLNATRIKLTNPAQSKLHCTGVDIKAVGSYPSIIKFLENLEQNSITGLEQVQLEADNNNTLNLRGKYFVYALRD